MSASVFRAAALAAASMFAALAWAQPAAPFRYEAVHSLDEMRELVRSRLPPGADAQALRRIFADEGGGSYRQHPRKAGSAKVLYDINLCGLYVWRWNISADADSSGHLLQAYVNGEPVHASGPQKRNGAALAASGRAKIVKAGRPRPEAAKGEKMLVYLLLDADGDLATLDDQVLAGAGPSRPDPVAMGFMHGYTDVEPWRSIFDADAADRIVDFGGSCPSRSASE